MEDGDGRGKKTSKKLKAMFAKVLTIFKAKRFLLSINYRYYYGLNITINSVKRAAFERVDGRLWDL